MNDPRTTKLPSWLVHRNNQSSCTICTVLGYLVPWGFLFCGSIISIIEISDYWSETAAWLSFIGVIILIGSYSLKRLTVHGFIATGSDSNFTIDRNGLETRTQTSLNARQDAAVEDYLERLEVSSLRITSLYMSYDIARSLLEAAATLRPSAIDEESIIRSYLRAMRTDLLISFGFRMEHTWTIIVYRREVDPTSGDAYLLGIAHERAIATALEDTRRWKEGVGVVGMSLARNDEIVVPDMISPEVRGLLGLHDNAIHPEDSTRYRSIVAVPIRVERDEYPWGVVAASCDEPGHFGFDDKRRVRPYPEEAARTLSRIIALTLAINRLSKNQVDRQISEEPENDLADFEGETRVRRVPHSGIPPTDSAAERISARFLSGDATPEDYSEYERLSALQRDNLIPITEQIEEKRTFGGGSSNDTLRRQPRSPRRTASRLS